MKRIIFILTIIFSLTFMFKFAVTANPSQPNEEFQDKRGHVFTKEQKALIDKKSKELKDKYLKGYEQMSPEVRNKAVEKYRSELRTYIKEQFGDIRKHHPEDPLKDFDVDYYMRKFIGE